MTAGELRDRIAALDDSAAVQLSDVVVCLHCGRMYERVECSWDQWGALTDGAPCHADECSGGS